MEAGGDPWRRDYIARRGPDWQLIRHTSTRVAGASRLYLVRYDVADAGLVEQFTWHVSPDLPNCYVKASVPSRLTEHYGTRIITMHQLLMWGSGRTGTRIAHLNGNGLDNRRENLAWMTQTEILAKRRPAGGASKYKGVTWDGERGKWGAVFRGKKLGRFDDEDEAARAFDDAAHAYWGPRAYLNFPARYPGGG